jgi:hypothetical protein
MDRKFSLWNWSPAVSPTPDDWDFLFDVYINLEWEPAFRAKIIRQHAIR